MKSKKQELIIFFKRNNGIIRFSDLLKAGFHPDTLNFLIEEKEVEKIARGLYKLAKYTLGTHPDLIIASLQVPKGIVCLLSALAFHEATSEIPKYVELSIPQGTRASKVEYPPIRFYRFAFKTWKSGIEEHEIEGNKIKVYNLAKTVADCFKFRNRIGMDVVRDALKIAIKEKHIKPKEIMHYAKICRVHSIVKPLLEAML